MKEHRLEIYSIECNHKDPNVFLTASADSEVKL